MSMVTTLITAGAVAAALTAVLILAVKVGRPVVRLGRTLTHFLEDWFGEAARPGYAGRPGVMERLAVLEVRTAELVPNEGASVRDAVDRIERKVSS